MSRLVLDVATCPLDGAADWLPAVRAARNLKDPQKIAADIADRTAAQQDGMGLDFDLCRISAIGVWDLSDPDYSCCVEIAATEQQEYVALKDWADEFRGYALITYNGIAFDMPLIERRLLYLGLEPMSWNLDKYRTNHIDLFQKLSGGDKTRYRSLEFYAKRLGWTDLVKPLTGAQEATALKDGKIEELRASVAHDVIATYRLAQWMRVITPAPVRTAASEEVDL